MKRLIGPLAAAAAATLGIGWLQLASHTLAAQADTPGVSPTCFSQSLNPHPTQAAGQTTDALFCTPAPSSGSGGGSPGSGSAGKGTNGSAQNAGYTTGSNGASGQGTTTAGATSIGNHAAATGGGGAGSKTGTATAASKASGGFFGGLVAFLGVAGGPSWFLWFLVLLAIVLFVVAVMAWVTRRKGGSLGSRLTRIAHRP